MICPGCEGKNRDEARFCTFCGTSLALRCAVCDTEIVPGGRFCDACGTPVGDAPAAAAETAIAARKVVTVLFADLTGSTALEENMDAESVRSVLDRFYAAMRAEVERHGGRVVKFTGDGVMAAFGVPEVSEDDAARAIQTAVAMRAECEQLDSVLELGLALKIGVNTGEVVVSASDEDVVGDAVNVAARLEGAASSGEVLVGEATWRLTRATSTYETVSPLLLKGKSEPVPAYRLLSVSGQIADAAAPFVGRDRELASLIAIFEDAVAANAARLVTIVGSPGLGKTRLARELMSELADRARVRETRCDPAGSSTLAPIAEALRGAASIPDDASEEDVVSALLALLPEDDDDRDRIAARAGAILGAGQPGTTEETFWAVRRLIEIAAKVAPVVLVLDDLHWAEPMLLDLVEHLADWIHDAPVLLVGTGRPELRDVRPSLVEGGRAAAVIALEGLDQSATQRLATELLGAPVPDELLARIPASTEGNPLFVRELIRMLVDDGVLRRDGDRWTVTVEVDAIQVPPTIQSLLAARVDRLASDERTVVELASVIGKEFYRGALHALAPPAVREQLDSCLESLRRKELVEPAGTYWIDEPVYRFHHALIRDAAYRRLLKESRAEIHERVAEWLERKTGDVLGEHEELIGYHLEQAHEYERQLGHTDEDLGRRASALLGIAARRALDRDDLPAAAALSGRSLALLPAEDAERSEMLLVRCEALLSMGDVAAGAGAVAELERLGTTPRLVAWATCFSGQLANLRSPERLQQTERSVAEAATVLAGLDDQVGAAKAHNVHASTLAGLGRFAECEAALDEALTAARAAGDNRRITATLGSAPPAALWGPNPVSRAGGRCLDIVRLLRITTGSPAVEATSLRCQAVLEAFRGRADAARRMLRSARRTLNELGLRHELLEAEQFAGIVELVAGDAAAAERHLRAAHEGFRKVGVDVLAAQSAALLARAHLALGEELEAEAFVGTSEQLGSQDLKTAIAWRSVRAEILARRGEFDEARRLAQAAVELAERTDALIDHGNACRSLATVCAAAGDAAAARSANERALALFERKGATALIDVVPAPSAKPPSAAPPAVAGPPANAASRTAAQIRDRFVERDWTGIAAFFEADISYEDRRRVLRQEPVVGRDALIETFKGMDAIGIVDVPSTVVATRGERLALLRGSFSGATFESEGLFIRELSERGLGSQQILFDPEDIDAAMAELDTRFIAGEGAPHSDVIRGYARHSRAVNDRDWDALRDAVTHDIVVVDHRPASLGEIRGSDAWVDAIKTLAGIFQFRHDAVAFHRIDGPRFVVQAQTAGVTNDGADVELAFFVVVVLDGDRIARWEFFPIEDLDAAVSRFDALAPAQATELAENRCARTAREFIRRVNAGDPASASALDADTMVLEDRRSGLRTVLRKPEAVENLRLGAEDHPRIDVRVVATRGERLALVETLWHAGPSGSYETEVLIVFEIGHDGLFSNVVQFDPESFDEAMAELDDRFIAGEGAHGRSVVEVYGGFERSYNSRDWGRLRELLTEDFTLVDHRLASLGTLGPDGYVEAMRTLVELIPGRIGRCAAVPALSSRAAATLWASSGQTADGAAIDENFYLLWLLRGELVVRSEIFPEQRLEDALARFEELTRDDTPRAAALNNQASRQTARAFEHVNREEFDAFAALHVGGARMEDRRHGLGSTTIGGAAIADQARVIVGVGANDIRYECVAVRGERLALGRVVYASDDAGTTFEVEVLQLTEADAAGLIVAWDTWDGDEATAAFAELTERFLAGEGAAHADIVRCEARRVDALNRRDWRELRHVFTDDFVLVDHRPVALGTIHGAEGWIDSIRELADVVAFRSDVVAYHRMEGDRFISQTVNRRETSDGNTVELPFLTVGVVRDGRMARWELFPLEGRAEAFARFEELGRREEPAAARRLDNAAERSQRRQGEAFIAQDWQTLDSLLSDDSMWEDRRPGLRTTLKGKSARLENARAMAAIGVTRRRSEPLAIRGDRLVLARVSLDGGDETSFASEVLMVTEVDGEGRVAASVVFGTDDVDAAFAELDDRYLASEGAPYAETWNVERSRIDAMNRCEWERYRSVHEEDVLVVDRRPASLGRIEGFDDFLRFVRTLRDQAPDFRRWAARIDAIDTDRVLMLFVGRGTTPEGAEVELVSYDLTVLRDGRIAQLEIFAEDDREAALARFDELGADEPPELSNLATSTTRRYWAALVAHDWSLVESLLADDAVWDDRRAGLRSTGVGKEFRLENAKAVASLGVGDFTYTAIALRGERLALGRLVVRMEPTTEAFEAEMLSLTEVDEQGHVVATVQFDTDDVDAAQYELTERYGVGEAAFCADLIHLGTSAISALNDRDLVAFGKTFGVDVVFVDRRPASFGEFRGRGRLVQMIRELPEVVPDVSHSVVDLRAVAPRALLATVVARGTNAGGGVVEIGYVQVHTIRDGLIDRVERFGIAQHDEALTRLEELSEEQPRAESLAWFEERGRSGPRASHELDAAVAVGALENLAARTGRQLHATYVRRDWEAFSALLTEDSTVDDRRRGLRFTVSGREARVENMRAIVGVGGAKMSTTLLATCGERLCLHRFVVRSDEDDGFDAEFLQLDEYDGTGRLAVTVVFDADDLDAAQAELDRRYLIAEGAAGAPSIELGLRGLSALNDRDWNGFAAIFMPDVVLVDRRPTSFGEFQGRDPFMAIVRELAEIMPDVEHSVVSKWTVGSSAVLGSFVARGTNSEGGEVEIVYLQLTTTAAGGLIDRIERFDLDQLDEAIARLEELGQAAPRAPDNTAMRVLERTLALMTQADWDAYAALYADDVRWEDRRTGLGYVTEERGEIVEGAKVVRELGADTFEMTPVATRGVRLALARGILRRRSSAASVESELLKLVEIDADGLIRAMINFDPADVDDAIDELDARYIAGEGRPYAEVFGLCVRQGRAYNTRDWDAYRDGLSDDFAFVDHRPAGAGTLFGADAHIEYLQILIDLAPDAKIRGSEVISIETDRILVCQQMRGTADDGGEIELTMLVLYVMGERRFSRLEVFPIDRSDAAVERFVETGPRRTTPPFENAAFRTMRRWRDALERADFDLLAELLSEDSVIDDRRAGLHDFCDGREACIANLRATFEVGTRHIASTPIAVRGDRLVLQHWTFGGREYGSTAFASEMIVVNEIDERGRHTAGVLFDVADMDEAFAELDARYIASEGAPSADAVHAEATLCQTLNRRDWDAFHALFADDFVLVDHRPASLGTLDADGWLTAQKAKIEIVPTYRGDPIYYHGLAPGRWWVQVLARATTDYDTDVDFSVQSVGQVRDGLIVRLDTFLDSQSAEAQALFEALGPDDSPAHVLENECTRHRVRWDRLFAARDWDAQREMFAEDLVSEDRRAGLRSHTVGREPFLQMLEVVRELGPALDVDVVATRGEHLALFRMRWRDPSTASDGFAVDVLQLHGLDDNGLLASVIVFDPDDIDAAVDELDERFLASDEATDAARGATETNRAYNARDWARFRQTMSDDFVFVDHHPASRGTIRGADAVVVHVKGLIDLVPDIHMVTRAFLGSEGDVSLRSVWIFGIDVNGSRVEFEYLNLSVGRDGRGTRLEIFPPERLDEAFVRFEQLAAST